MVLKCFGLVMMGNDYVVVVEKSSVGGMGEVRAEFGGG